MIRLVAALLLSSLFLARAWVLPPTGLSTRPLFIGGQQQQHQQQHEPLLILSASAGFGGPFNATETTTADGSPKKKTSSGYVRVEEWDQARKTSVEWEEKVKFDGHVQGNRWQQHEILRHHLYR